MCVGNEGRPRTGVGSTVLKSHQVDIFEDGIGLFIVIYGKPYRVGTYYCYDKAKKELFTWLE